MASVTMPSPVSLARFRQVSQAFFAQALKRVRRSARLVGAAAQELAAGGFHGARRCQNLFAAFHRTGARAERQFGAAHRDARHVHHGVVGLHFAADQLVGFRNRDGFGDARQVLEFGRRHGAVIAGDADGGALRARHDVGAEAEALNFRANAGDILLGGVRAHNH